MMKVAIIGAGTAAINVADILIQDRNFKVAGFVGTKKEESNLSGKNIYGDIPFLGDRSILKKLMENNIGAFIVGIGDNFIRERAYYEAMNARLTPINAISRHAIIEPSSRIGKGVVISAGCIVAHGVSIGNNSYLGSGVIVEICSKIGENCYLYSGSIIGGKSEIGRNVSLGIKSCIKSYVKVGKNQEITSGTVIESDLPDLIRSGRETTI